MAECIEFDFPAAKRSRVSRSVPGHGGVAKARAEREIAEPEREIAEWDAWWEEVHDGLGWGDGFGNDDDGEPLYEGLVIFRNDILPYTDTDAADEEAKRDAARLVSVIADKGVVETRTLDLHSVTLLVTAIVKSGRSVRHILVHALPEHAHDWQQTQIHLHGEGGQIITDTSLPIPQRKLNERTLLIDEIGNASLQDSVKDAGGMVVVVK